MGRPKFDLTKADPEYFSRLRQRVAMAAERGIYVSVMLFEGWAVQFSPGRDSHPFHRANNVNEVHYGDDAASIHTLSHPRITNIQQRHIQNVVDTVNEFDNVLYEIVNESGPYSTEWQDHMIRYLRQYQAEKPNQHPIGMTYQHRGGLNEALFNSDADWISPGVDSGRYRDDPEVAQGRKVILTDTDHLGGSAFGDRKWVWKSFARGLNPIFMDRYELPESVTDVRYEKAREIRVAMGLTRLLAQRVNFVTLSPQPELSSDGFVLAGPNELLVYQPMQRPAFVDLRRYSDTFVAEWINTETGAVTKGETVEPGSKVILVRPPGFDEDVVLYLRSTDFTPEMTASEFEIRARGIVDASVRAIRSPGYLDLTRSIAPFLAEQLARAGLRYSAVVFFAGLLFGTIVCLITLRIMPKCVNRFRR